MSSSPTKLLYILQQLFLVVDIHNVKTIKSQEKLVDFNTFFHSPPLFDQFKIFFLKALMASKCVSQEVFKLVRPEEF